MIIKDLRIKILLIMNPMGNIDALQDIIQELSMIMFEESKTLEES